MRYSVTLRAIVIACSIIFVVNVNVKAAVERERTVLGGWGLDIARDRFSGEVTCRLAARDGRAFYRAKAVAFRFRIGRDVRNAVYRIGDGEARAERDDLPVLVAQGVPLDRGGMGNALGGIVWVPFDVLREGSSIAIEPGRGSRARHLHFNGLVALHEMAVARGCAPESRFVER